MRADARLRSLPRRLPLAALIVAAALAHPSVEAVGAWGAADQRSSAVSDVPVWPLPPAQPRVRYVTSYHGIDDFQTKKPSAWKRMLLGPDEQADHSADMMIKPYSIAVAPDGRVYVTDTAARRVFVFDAESKTVSFLGGTGQGKLTKPVGVAVDADGKVFVADATAKRVFGYDKAGTLRLAVGQEDEFANPAGLAIDRAAHRLYVADTARHEIRCYSTADGAFERTIGRRGTTPGTFNYPTNVFVDRQGRLYVSDTMNFRLQVFDTDGKLMGAFGEQGDTPGTLNRPKGVGVDSEGHIYIADSSFNNFQIFDDTGHLLLIVGSGGNAPGEFLLPAGLYIDAKDRIYVADQGNSRVQVFQYLRGNTR
jgi:DNA-binding beta-propeller fold protein YncE